MAKQFTLGKNERLKSRKQIEQLFKAGKSLVVTPFRIHYSFLETCVQHSKFNIRFGVGLSSRNFKRSVDRNRIKRLTREAWRLQKNELQESLKKNNRQLNIFFIYTGKELPDFRIVNDKVALALKKISGKIHENNSTNT